MFYIEAIDKYLSENIEKSNFFDGFYGELKVRVNIDARIEIRGFGSESPM